MIRHSLSNLTLYFFVYAVIGWICEVVYCSIPEKKFVNRGFLYGPYCPIYGFGALLVLLPLEPLRSYPLLVFFCAIVLTSALEYLTSWLMEKLFGIRWWDYSGRRFNLNGRVCLLNSALFGLMGLVMMYVIHSPVSRLLDRIPGTYQRLTASALVVVFFLDLVVTLNVLAGLEEKLWMAQSLLSELRRSNREHGWYDESRPPRSLEHLRELAGDKLPPALLAQIESAAGFPRRSLRRILDSFPGMRHTRLNETLQTLRTAMDAKRADLKAKRAELKTMQAELKAKQKELRESWNRRLWKNTKRLGRKTGAAIKQQAVSFADGINFYKLCWVFFIACVAGFVVESLYCLVLNGYIESRQGMLYGPFNQVYGFGAVLMVLLLHRLAGAKDRWLFLGSALVGGAFEYICSLLQEKMFGSVSWEYSEHPFNLGGRTSLTYMFFWGILGVALIKGIYPWMSRLIEKIPNRQGIFFTWLFLILLCANMLLSGLAVARWSERTAGIPPQNAVEEFLDENYPDDLLSEIYPNMRMLS